MPSMLKEEVLEKPLAIIGEEDVILGFRALGFQIYTAQDEREFKAGLDTAVKQGCVVCLVQDNFYQSAREYLEHYQNLPLPVFLPFSKDAKADLLQERVKGIRLRATGTI